MTGEGLIQVMVDRIVARFAPVRVILFGSQARGDAGSHSDVDLLVVLDEVKDRRQDAIRIRQALADVPLAKDIFVATPEDLRLRGNLVGSILRPALREGKYCMSELNYQEAVRWLQYARQDLATVNKMLQEGGFSYRHACFWSQQAAEKALKSIFVYLQIDYPWRHDLDALRSILPDNWPVKRLQADLSRLTEWAVEARYPGEWTEATQEDAQWAYRQASAIVESITVEFIRRGVDLG